MLHRLTRCFLLATLLACAAAAHPTISKAGSYEVLSCNELRPGDWEGAVWTAYVSIGRCFVGPYPNVGDAPQGAAASLTFRSVPGTWISGMRFSYDLEQTNNWVGGIAQPGSWLLGGPQCAGVCRGRGYMEFGNLRTSEIYSQMYCLAARCSTGPPMAKMSMLDARITIEDPTKPDIAGVRGGLWTDQWQGGRREVLFNASDNSGIEFVGASIDDEPVGRSTRECDWYRKTCPDWPDAGFSVLTSDGIGDGRHTLTLVAVDRGRNPAEVSQTIWIDNTPPAAPEDVHLTGGSSWRPMNRFNLAWTNPSQADRAPIAGAMYRICPVASTGGRCEEHRVSGRDLREVKDLKVPGPGEWTLRLWLVDSAGNARFETAAPPVRLGLDDDAPDLSILPQSPGDPTRVLLQATDRTSPLRNGDLELRREGTTTWHVMHGERTKEGFETRIADEELPDGQYEMRARVFDAAGNERSTDRFATGEPARVTLPVRIRSRLVAGRSGRRICRGRGQRRHCRRRLNTKPSVRYRRPVRLRGRLTLPGRRPLARTEVEVWEQVELSGAPMRRLSSVRTSRTGRFRFRAPAGPARVIRFRYPGTKTIRPRNADVRLRVRASTSLRVSDRRVVNGEYVTFRGRVRGRPLPASGKLVELQAYSRGGWRTFAQPRASARTGRWAYRYRFQATRGRVRYRIRARVRQEATYPFHTGTSRPIRVAVRGL